ncbi:hypothetical protein [Methylobacterium nigriterrae]|uniref:hypothetical protein n=1 Tax=Methylobacterium nigriterrae TaxID=3127512 RepID=UPI003013C38D
MCLLDRKLGRGTRDFGYVKLDSDAASYDVYEIPYSGSENATASDAEAEALVREHGARVTALVTYNS